MTAHTQTILRNLGVMLHVPGLMAGVSLPVAWGFGETVIVAPLLWTALASFGVGQGLYWGCRRTETTRLHHAMLIAALSWLFVPFIGALPFWLTAEALASSQAPWSVLLFQSPVNALFESFSGFTGTGLTMTPKPSELLHTLQWWRSLMEWVGGVGVIVLMLSILKPTAGAYRLFYSEGREEKIFPTVTSTVRTIWWIYLLYTAFSILLLLGLGMPWWAAINHGMTGVSTGGFGITDNSIGDYGTLIKLGVLPIMLLGAISFSMHYEVLRRRRWRALGEDAQHRLLWGFLLWGALLLWLENWWFGQGHVVDTVFQWVSALTTAGFQTVNLHEWSPTAKLLLSLAMISGGAAGSTVGGLKLFRVMLLKQGLSWRFRRVRMKPDEVVAYKIDGRNLSEDEAYRVVEGASVLASLWLVVLWVGILMLIHLVPERFSLSDVILEVASAQGNVGLSSGITDASLPPLAKIVLMVCMWVGRLEIIPVLIFLTAAYRAVRDRLK